MTRISPIMEHEKWVAGWETYATVGAVRSTGPSKSRIGLATKAVSDISGMSAAFLDV